jgi:hypothetical protein
MPRPPGSKDTRSRKKRRHERCDKLDDAEKVLRAQRSAWQSKIKKHKERGAERRAALGCASLFDMVRFVPALALVQTCDSHLLQGLVTNGRTGGTGREAAAVWSSSEGACQQGRGCAGSLDAAAAVPSTPAADGAAAGVAGVAGADSED